MDDTVRTILRKNAASGAAPEGFGTAALGMAVRTLRKEKGLTQADLAARSGVSHSALSKIENSQLSPTFETLLRIASGLAIDISELLASFDTRPHRTRRVVTRRGEGEVHEADNYVYETLCHELTNKRMIPLVGRIKAHSIQAFGKLLRHPGEEVVYVLEGEIEVHTEHYAPARLAKGDCAYFDSTMGHACISTGKQDAVVFWVSTPS